MKGAIKTETIDGMSFDIRKEGSTIALEAQAIFYELIFGGGAPLDKDLSYGEIEVYMMRGMHRGIIKRIKMLFIDCIVSPKIDDESFEDIPPNIITNLFFKIHRYQIGSADKKKESSGESQESQTNSKEKK